MLHTHPLHVNFVKQENNDSLREMERYLTFVDNEASASITGNASLG